VLAQVRFFPRNYVLFKRQRRLVLRNLANSEKCPFYIPVPVPVAVLPAEHRQRVITCSLDEALLIPVPFTFQAKYMKITASTYL
jgi:hypothetical protein